MSQNQDTNTHVSKKQAALQAAQKALQLARQSPDDATSHQLHAARYLLEADSIDKAEQVLNQIKIQSIGSALDANLQLLKAQSQLKRGAPLKAEQYLNRIWTPQQLPLDTRLKLYQTRATTYQRLGKPLEAAKEHIRLEPLLTTKKAIKKNSQKIWEILSQLTPNTLRSLQRHQTNDSINGWIAFAYITKQYDTHPDQLLRAIEVWQRRFSEHPAINILPDFTYEQLQAQQTVEEPEKKPIEKKTAQRFALLLPLKGDYRSSAQAIRDGFLSAYYQEQNKTAEAEIIIYDTSNSKGALLAYEQALLDKVDFIIGPLLKKEVESLVNLEELQVPVLALNTPSNFQKSRVPTNLFQFGLLPETEAIAVAKKAWQDGYRRALLIAPDTQWGKRMHWAFAQQWEQQGGQLLAVEHFNKEQELSQAVMKVLSIDSSEARARALRQSGLKFHFTPRRRQDPDFIFLATDPISARQLKPLLNFYYAQNLPVYGTSSLYAGQINKIRDQDLNGITFCDMPWTLDDSIRSRKTYKTLKKLWPSEFQQYTRLYALGLDAYHISHHLNHLQLFPDFGISGMTGMLKLTKDNRIERRLLWATFEKGIAEVLPEGTS